MTKTPDSRPDLRRLRPAAWGTAAALILAPLMAMRFTGHLQWQLGDLAFAFAFIGGAGLAFELAVRTSPHRSYRAGAALALATAFVLAWSNLAVGVIGSEDNVLNSIYFGVIVVALAGSAIAAFRAHGMAKAMLAAAATQLTVAAVALFHGHFTGPITVLFTALWLASAWLFDKAARARAAA